MPLQDDRSFFGSLNNIVALVESTCEDKWDVLIKTALPAAGEALYLLIIPSPEEILESYLHPRTRRGDPKRAKGGSGRRQVTRYGALRWWQKIGFPDIDNIIADILPGRDLHRGRTAGGKENWFWTGIDIIDRGLWYWLLLDVGETFIVQWGTGILESRFCSSPFSAMLILEGTGMPDFSTANFWDTTHLPNVSAAKGWEILNNGLALRLTGNPPAFGHCMLHFSGQVPEGPGTFERHFTANIRVNPITGPDFTISSEEAPAKPGEAFTCDISAELPPHTSLRPFLNIRAGEPGTAVNNPQWRLTGMFNT